MKKKYQTLLSLVMVAYIMLGIHNGNVALWKGDDPQPYAVFSVSADSLPADIQNKLSKGIHVTSKWQLYRLLESVLS